MNIQADNLTFSYFKKGKAIVDHLTTTFEKNDISLLMGNTGEGKSTFLYLAAGLYPHYAGVILDGCVTVDGQELQKLSPVERCHMAGMMFQNPDLQFCMDTVFNEMVFCLENVDEDPSVFENKINEALSFCEIQYLKNRKLQTLSGGEKQKVALACLVLLHPQYMLLDEPFANIDENSRKFLTRKLQQIHTQFKIGIIVVDHHPENWIHVATAVYKMENGKIHKEGINDVHKAYIQSSVLMPSSQLQNAPAVLQFDGVSIRHTKKDTKDTLSNIHAVFHQGGIYAIMGESGCGKSTLFHAITGLYPYSGTIYFQSRSLKQMRKKIRGQIGMITQSPQDQFIGGNVRQEVEAGIFNKEKKQAKSEEMLRSIHLWKYRDVSPYMLSQGQQRRLGIATMMNSGCRLLLADEPTYAQDAANACRIMDHLISNARQKNITMLFSTHDRDIADAYADEIWQIQDHTLTKRK